jgi:hypothetical protein
MAKVLLQTNLHIAPVCPELVSSPRLTERLSAGLHHQLTLVSAPWYGSDTATQADRDFYLPKPAAWCTSVLSDGV